MMKAKQSPERWRHHVGKKVAKLELSLVSFTVVLLASFIEFGHVEFDKNHHVLIDV